MRAKPERVFGRRESGKTYRLRPGGYAIARKESGEVLVAIAENGFYLPGGGQEGDESPEEAAVRETLEECGFHVRLLGPVGIADELVFSSGERAHFRKRCTFFTAAVVTQVDGAVAEHGVTWMMPADAVLRLTHGSQRWAVRRACGLTDAGGEGE